MTESLLDRELLTRYCETFLGYGNCQAPIWFIGLEEAGGRCLEVVQNRLERWQGKFREQNVIDGAEFHKGMNDSEGCDMGVLFEENSPSQPTWDRLIRLQLAYQGKPVSKEDVKKFRSTSWARANSPNCLLELFPLPSPDINTWNYDQWTGSSAGFATREEYRQTQREPRIRSLRDKIAKHSPEVVVFYGRSAAKSWSGIVGAPWREITPCPNSKAKFRQVGKTLYALIPHPAARGVENVDFEIIGRVLREKMSAQ